MSVAIRPARLTALLLICISASLAWAAPGSAAAAEGEELSTSPDGRFSIQKVVDAQGSTNFQIVEDKTSRRVGLFPKGDGALFVESAVFVWAPDSRRFAWNHQEGGRYSTTSIFQYLKGKFVELKSPEDRLGYSLIERERARQLAEMKLSAKAYQRRISDTWEVKRWIDAATAEVLVRSIRSLPQDGDVDLDIWVRHTLKFAPDGTWKVTRSHVLTEQEAEKAAADE